MLCGFTAFEYDETAVKPVLAVAFLIVTTFVLTMLIGAYMFGVEGEFSEPGPDADISFTYNDTSDVVYITHNGSDPIDSTNTGVLVINHAGNETTWDPDDVGYLSPNGEEAMVTQEIADGNTIARVDDMEPGDEIQLIWQSTDGDMSSILGEFEVP